MTNPRPFPEPTRSREALRSDAEPAPIPSTRPARAPDPRLPPTPPPATATRSVTPEAPRAPSRPPAVTPDRDDKPTVMEPLPRAPAPPPVFDESEPDPADRSWLPWLAAAVFIGGGLAVILLSLLFAGMWLYTAQTGGIPAEPPATTPAATPEAKAAPTTTEAKAAPSSPATASGTALDIAITGVNPQWMKVLDGETMLLKGTTSLSGAVPAGTHTLALKAVGKPELRGTVTVGTTPLTLRCAAEADAVVCTGGAAPIKLSPK